MDWKNMQNLMCEIERKNDEKSYAKNGGPLNSNVERHLNDWEDCIPRQEQMKNI